MIAEVTKAQLSVETGNKSVNLLNSHEIDIRARRPARRATSRFVPAAGAGTARVTVRGAAIGDGERWGGLSQDRATRFVVAWAGGPRENELAETVVQATRQRTKG